MLQQMSTVCGSPSTAEGTRFLVQPWRGLGDAPCRSIFFRVEAAARCITRAAAGLWQANPRFDRQTGRFAAGGKAKGRRHSPTRSHKPPFAVPECPPQELHGLFRTVMKLAGGGDTAPQPAKDTMRCTLCFGESPTRYSLVPPQSWFASTFFFHSPFLFVGSIGALYTLHSGYAWGHTGRAAQCVCSAAVRDEGVFTCSAHTTAKLSSGTDV